MIDETGKDERLRRGVSELNDLLVSILGNAGLLLLDLPAQSPFLKSIRNIETAAKRAAEVSEEMSALFDDEDIDQEGRITPVEPFAPMNAEADHPTRPMVLLVDDDALVRRTVSALLENLGYEAIVAEEGLQAIEAYRARGSEIDAVILDLVMPGMDGADVLRELRKIDPDVKILLSYGGRQRIAAEVAKTSRVTGTLEKPYLPSDLATALEGIIFDGRFREES